MIRSYRRTLESSFDQKLVSAILLGLSFGISWLSLQPALGQLDRDCRIPQGLAMEKDTLLQQARQGDRTAQTRYQEVLAQHANSLATCRRNTWPKNQAVWLRLYPCDSRAGVLEQVFDQVVNLGYNQVYVEVFYDGRVLLPAANNPTAWPSVINHPAYTQVDLLAEAIAKGRARGLKVYAWLFSMNFGYSYAQRGDRQAAIAVNGRGQTSLNLVSDGPQVFIDPYNRQALADYTAVVQEILDRRPDGILFDYIRFPRGTGTASVVTRAQDLPIYAPASQAALLQRARNNKGREVIARFLRQGTLTPADIAQINQRYPQEPQALWEGRAIVPADKALSAKQQQSLLLKDLWLLGVAHAYQGVVDFLSSVVRLAQRSSVPAGAVFFPGGNQLVGQQGFDARLQPWDQFPSTIQWHPMAYATCSDTSCIMNEIRQVLRKAPRGTRVQPALAGAWGRNYGPRPTLETQMRALRNLSGQIDTVSHFAFSWTEPQNDQQRKACRLGS